MLCTKLLLVVVCSHSENETESTWRDDIRSRVGMVLDYCSSSFSFSTKVPSTFITRMSSLISLHTSSSFSFSFSMSFSFFLCVCAVMWCISTRNTMIESRCGSVDWGGRARQSQQKGVVGGRVTDRVGVMMSLE